MVDLSNYPYPTYEPNKAAAGVLAGIIAVSSVAWIIQSIQARMNPRRLVIVLLISHLTLFVEFVLRAALSPQDRRTRLSFTITTALLAISQRMLIVANMQFLVQSSNLNARWARAITIGTTLSVLTSAVIMIVAGALSYGKNVERSFHLRQAAAAIVLLLTLVLYPIWFFSKSIREMTKLGVLLLAVSSLASLVIAVFLLFISIPSYYVSTNAQESWFYIFFVTPLVIALLVWTVLHPKRSLAPARQPQNEIELKRHDNL